METKHLGHAAYDLWEHSDSLVRAVVERVLRSVHENRLALRMLVEINECYYLLAVVVLSACALETVEQTPHCHHLWY